MWDSGCSTLLRVPVSFFFEGAPQVPGQDDIKRVRLFPNTYPTTSRAVMASISPRLSCGYSLLVGPGVAISDREEPTRPFCLTKNHLRRGRRTRRKTGRKIRTQKIVIVRGAHKKEVTQAQAVLPISPASSSKSKRARGFSSCLIEEALRPSRTWWQVRSTW
jgi:hypothetical protein